MPIDAVFLSDIWLYAAQHYWYLEGHDPHDSRMNQFFWTSILAADLGEEAAS